MAIAGQLNSRISMETVLRLDPDGLSTRSTWATDAERRQRQPTNERLGSAHGVDGREDATGSRCDDRCCRADRGPSAPRSGWCPRCRGARTMTTRLRIAGVRTRRRPAAGRYVRRAVEAAVARRGEEHTARHRRRPPHVNRDVQLTIARWPSGIHGHGGRPLICRSRCGLICHSSPGTGPDGTLPGSLVEATRIGRRWAGDAAHGLLGLRDRLLQTLSGGERQRVLLAACLAGSPALRCWTSRHLSTSSQMQLLSDAGERARRRVPAVSLISTCPGLCSGLIVIAEGARTDASIEEAVADRVAVALLVAPYADLDCGRAALGGVP